MFGKCLWLKIKNKKLIDIHKHISNKYSHISFEPHVTISTKVNTNYINNYIDKFRKHKPKILIDLSQPIICDCDLFDDIEFYSIYISVKVIDFPMPKECNPHISFAYKINNDFSKNDVNDIVKILSESSNTIHIDYEPILSVQTCELSKKPWVGNNIMIQ